MSSVGMMLLAEQVRSLRSLSDKQLDVLKGAINNETAFRRRNPPLELTELEKATATREKVRAIRVVRERTGCNIYAGKRAVEAFLKTIKEEASQ